MLPTGHPLEKLLRRDTRFHIEAYVFIFDALRYAQEDLGMGTPSTSEDVGAQEEPDDVRHLTGQELCEAIRLYSLEQFGLLAKNVLDYWGIRSTGDFGEIVFNLIEIGQMRKTDNDRREDFDHVFDFDEGLRQSFQISLPRRSEEHRP